MGSIRTVDIHLLELRYAHCRIMNHQALKRLRDSIETYGQIVPALAVEEKDKLILMDGYLRVRALRACGKDRICVQLSKENEQDAMFSLFTKADERQWGVIEQSVLLQELHRRFGCSLSDIAKRIGRDKSFVKRRLDLVEALPENILKAAIAGSLSTWSAGRVMAPLARANGEDAQKLMAHLEKEPLSTRELARFYAHYQKSNRPVRDNIRKKISAQCASLIPAFCRRIFIQYYPCFTRFECKVFLNKAFEFLDGVCSRCMIDNTSVIVVSGTGPDAVIAPEMKYFGDMYGTRFEAHAVGDANRSARVERPFHLLILPTLCFN